MRAMREHNFIVKNERYLPGDEELFFGPGQKVEVVEAFNLPDTLVKLEVFPSKGQARKNGFGTTPDGFNDLVVGKLRTRLTWLIPTGDMEPECAQ